MRTYEARCCYRRNTEQLRTCRAGDSSRTRSGTSFLAVRTLSARAAPLRPLPPLAALPAVRCAHRRAQTHRRASTLTRSPLRPGVAQPPMSDTASKEEHEDSTCFVGEKFTEDVKVYPTKKENDTAVTVAAELAARGSMMTADEIVALNRQRQNFRGLKKNSKLEKATFLLVHGLGDQDSTVTEVEYTTKGAAFTVAHKISHDGEQYKITQLVDEPTLLRGLGVRLDNEHVGKTLIHTDHGVEGLGGVPSTVVGYNDDNKDPTWLIRHNDDTLYYKDVDQKELAECMLALQQQADAAAQDMDDDEDDVNVDDAAAGEEMQPKHVDPIQDNDTTRTDTAPGSKRSLSPTAPPPKRAKKTLDMGGAAAPNANEEEEEAMGLEAQPPAVANEGPAAMELGGTAGLLSGNTDGDADAAAVAAARAADDDDNDDDDDDDEDDDDLMRVDPTSDTILGDDSASSGNDEVEDTDDLLPTGTVVAQSELMNKAAHFDDVKLKIGILAKQESKTADTRMLAIQTLETLNSKRVALKEREQALDDTNESIGGRRAIISELLEIMNLFDNELNSLLGLEVVTAANDLDAAIGNFNSAVDECMQTVTSEKNKADTKVAAAAENLAAARKTFGESISAPGAKASDKESEFAQLGNDEKKMSELIAEQTDKYEKHQDVLQLQQCAKEVCKGLKEQSKLLQSIKTDRHPQAIGEYRKDGINVCHLLCEQFGSLSRVVRALLLVGPDISTATGYRPEIGLETIKTRNDEFKKHADLLKVHIDNWHADTTEDEEVKAQASKGMMMVQDMRTLLSLYASDKNCYEGDQQNMQPHGDGTLSVPGFGVYRGRFDRGLPHGEGTWTMGVLPGDQPTAGEELEVSGNWEGLQPAQAAEGAEANAYTEKCLIEGAVSTERTIKLTVGPKPDGTRAWIAVEQPAEEPAQPGFLARLTGGWFGV